MVDISLYKGNLHKVPDVPRRWTPQTPKISPEDFKILISRRASALSRLLSSSDDTHAEVTTTSITSPSPASSPDHFDTDRSSDDDDAMNHVDHQPELSPKGDLKEEEDFLGKSMEKTDALMEEEDEKPEVIVNTVVEKSNTENGSGDVEKRKREVKEKLEILNEKKHSLVQVLKQILNAEEHLKRQNSAQRTPSRPPPLQVDTITDSGSMTKVNTPRVGLNGNPCGDVEGGEGDDASNHNLPSLNLPRMSSTSPSSDSQQRKPASGMDHSGGCRL